MTHKPITSFSITFTPGKYLFKNTNKHASIPTILSTAFGRNKQKATKGPVVLTAVIIALIQWRLVHKGRYGGGMGILKIIYKYN